MNIILGEDRAQALADRYLILSLDTFAIQGQSQPVKSFCVLAEISVNDLPQVEVWKDLHENLIKNYARQNWNFCEQAIGHLMGKWNSELDSFYTDLAQRIEKVKDLNDPDWTPIITR